MLIALSTGDISLAKLNDKIVTTISPQGHDRNNESIDIQHIDTRNTPTFFFVLRTKITELRITTTLLNTIKNETSKLVSLIYMCRGDKYHMDQTIVSDNKPSSVIHISILI